MVDGVVVDVATDREGRLGERRRPRPLEAHALVTGHVDDQAAALEQLEILVGDEDQRVIGVLQDAVDDDVVPGQVLRQRAALRVRQLRAPRRIGIVSVVVHQPRGRHRRGHGRDVSMRQHGHLMYAHRQQRSDGAARGRAEADHGRPQLRAEVPGGASQLQRMQHRAVTGQLVVHVEHVQAEGAVGRPVVHRLPGDHGQPAVDPDLRQLRVLDAVRPAPQHLARPHRGQVAADRLGQHHDVAVREQLLARTQPTHLCLQLRIRVPVAVSVPVLEEHAAAQLGVDAFQVPRMNRQPALILLGRRRNDAECQPVHVRKMVPGVF